MPPNDFASNVDAKAMRQSLIKNVMLLPDTLVSLIAARDYMQAQTLAANPSASVFVRLNVVNDRLRLSIEWDEPIADKAAISDKRSGTVAWLIAQLAVLPASPKLTVSDLRKLCDELQRISCGQILCISAPAQSRRMYDGFDPVPPQRKD